LLNKTYIVARNVLSRLNSAGFEAYIVGGFVRNFLLGKNDSTDIDIATSATPNQVQTIFSKTIETGIKHGTVTVIFEDESFEITTYRIESEYQDKRRPSEVHFTTDLIEDLKRRDFTFNAMAMDYDGNIIDPFNGRIDLENKIIRTVGNPDERFEEDPLRILRGIRFLATLGKGFKIDDKTLSAMSKYAHLLEKISPERIQIELVKTIVSENVWALKVAYLAGITKYFFPEFDNVDDHILHTLENIKPTGALRLTVLLLDIANAKTIMKRLKFDNKTINLVTNLIEYHNYPLPTTKKATRRAINKIGLQNFPLYLKIREADILGQSLSNRELKISQLQLTKQLYFDIINDGEATSLDGLAISGRDLINFGIKPGPKMGFILNELLHLVIENPIFNTKDKLLEIVEEKYIEGE